MKWVSLMMLMAGCATTPAPRLAGLYQFPEAAELHYPLLWLDDQGHFAFLADPAEPAEAVNAPNSGTYQRVGSDLHLRYLQTYCCQFADRDQERIRIEAVTPERWQVQFRENTYELKRVQPGP